MEADGFVPVRAGELVKRVGPYVPTRYGVTLLTPEQVRRDREAAFHAVACCPVISAVLPLPKIREMFDQMWEAEKELLTW